VTFVITRSGFAVSLSAPHPATIQITDIALALSRTPRFNGHTSRAWSIADHSLLVLELLLAAQPDAPTPLRLAALLHDGHEAYAGDQVTPLQQELARRSGTTPSARAILRGIQGDIDAAIARAFGFESALFHHPAVHQADQLAVAIEAQLLMPAHATAWQGLPRPPEPLPVLATRGQAEAERAFLGEALALLSLVEP
jgi:uncharacterized protein